MFVVCVGVSYVFLLNVLDGFLQLIFKFVLVDSMDVGNIVMYVLFGELG